MRRIQKSQEIGKGLCRIKILSKATLELLSKLQGIDVEPDGRVIFEKKYFKDVMNVVYRKKGK
jgi:hypothetical protein